MSWKLEHGTAEQKAEAEAPLRFLCFPLVFSFVFTAKTKAVPWRDRPENEEKHGGRDPEGGGEAGEAVVAVLVRPRSARRSLQKALNVACYYASWKQNSERETSREVSGARPVISSPPGSCVCSNFCLTFRALAVAASVGAEARTL